MWSLYSRKFLRSLWGTFWILLSSGLLAVALLVVLLRVTLPGMEYLKPELERWIEAESGAAVEIGDLAFTLKGRFLEVSAGQVVVLEAEDGAAHASFERAALQIDLLHSLSSWTLVSDHFSVTRPKLEITRNHDGQILIGAAEGKGQVKGLERGGAQSAPLLGWLLEQPNLQIHDAELLLRERHLTQLEWYLSDVDLELVNSGYRHQVTGSVQLAGQKEPLAVELEWFGDLLNPQGWDGQLHLKGESLQLMPLIGSAATPLAVLARGEMNLEFWGEWLSGRLEKGRGRLRRSEAYLDAAGLASGEFYWKRQDEAAWRLQMERLVWGGEQEFERKSHPSSALLIRKRSAQGRDTLLGAVDHLQLVSSPERSGLYATIAQGAGGVTVAGELHGLQFRSFPTAESLFSGVEARLDLHQLSLQGTKQLSGYGVAGVSGQLHLNEMEGYFLPQPGTLSFGTGALYPQQLALELDLQQGLLQWRRRTDGVLLTLDRLQGQVGDLVIGGGVQLLSPAAGGAPLMNMALELEAQRVTDVVQLLPESQLGTELYEWILNAVQSGRLKRGRVALQGPLDARFPYPQGAGQFAVSLELEDLYLQYDPEWPSITHSQAQLNFNNHTMQIELNEGKIDGHPIHSVKASGMTLGNHPLQIDGRLISDSSKLLRTLERTPLQGVAQSLNRVMDLQGYALLNLDLEIPLDGGEAQVKGQVELHDNTLLVPDIDLQVHQLEGNIDFTGESVTIEGMQGEMLGGPLHLTAFSAEREQRQQVVVNMNGALADESLKSWLGLAEQQQGLFKAREPIAWSGRLTLDEEDLQLHLHSDLKGLALETPAPLNKLYGEVWPTTLTLGLHQGAVNELQISTPKRLFAALNTVKHEAQGPAEWHGQIRFGDVQQEVAAEALRRGITLQGVFDWVNLDAWYRLWKGQLDQSAGGAEGEAPILIDQILVLSKRAELFEQQLQDLSLVMERDTSGRWGIGVSSAQVEGRILVPASTGETLLIALNHLQLGAVGESGEESARSREIDPGQFPAMEVSSKKTVINGIDFGALSLKTHPTQSGLFVDDASLRSTVMEATMQGSWLQRNGVPLSRFNIHVTGDELGKILGQFGYSGQIDRGKSVIQLNAEWPDSPLDFSLSKMEGELQVSVEKGQLQDVDQGVGRVFGLLGIHTLVRRLTLDFSDITDKGFAFDTISGSFAVEAGDAHTRDLVIDGPSATIKVAGRTGIVERDYDQEIAVSPKISETLPATGALVGGPAGAAVGSVLLLYQKLFQKEGLATTRYHLQGSWDDPQLEEIRARAPVSEPALIE